MFKLPYTLYAILWHFKNRHWKNTRQKRKAFEKDYYNYKRR